jgi:hypothetical protein
VGVYVFICCGYLGLGGEGFGLVFGFGGLGGWWLGLLRQRIGQVEESKARMGYSRLELFFYTCLFIFLSFVLVMNILSRPTPILFLVLLYFKDCITVGVHFLVFFFFVFVFVNHLVISIFKIWKRSALSISFSYKRTREAAVLFHS